MGAEMDLRNMGIKIWRTRASDRAEREAKARLKGLNCQRRRTKERKIRQLIIHSCAQYLLEVYR
jgi:hypothetical protein